MAAAFSASDVAFEGFRLARERPTSILVWTGLTLILSVLSAWVLVTLAGEAFAEMLAISRAGGEPDPAEAAAVFGRVAPAYAVLTPLSLAFYAVLYAAVYRAVLRPREAPGTGDVRLGGDELRQALALLVVSLVLFACFVVALFLTGLVGGLLAAAAGALGRGVAVLALLATAALMIWLSVRLSLVAPYVFDRRALHLGAAWRLTKGTFWPLFGAYLLAAALTVVVFLLGLIIYTFLAVAVGGGVGAVTGVFQPDFSSLGAYFTPAMLVYLLVGSLLSALTFAIMVGASGAAYRALSPSGEAEVF